MADNNNNWERDALEKIATAGLNEQRRARRWGIFFKLLGFGYLFAVLALFLPDKDSTLVHKTSGRHTALVELNGVIMPGSEASADNVVTGLRRAFENEQSAGVVLRINSPGGSPVQAGYIYDEIMRLKTKYPEKPIYAVISDICASGGYYVAAATDKIYADKASLVGSIGVRMDNFGFVEAMKKLGVERRTLTAGKNKALMDPFAPADPQVEKHMQSLLNNIHQQFIDAVRKGRGDRLMEVQGLFSGLIWTGDQSVEIGLVDDLSSASKVARDVIGAEDIVDYTMKPDFLERISRNIGTVMANFMVEQSLLPQLQ